MLDISSENASKNTYEIANLIQDSATPYGDLTTVARDDRIDVSSETPLSEQVETFSSGVSHDSSNSKYRLRANDNTEFLQTVDSLQYTPGYIAEVGIALQIPTAPTGNQDVRWGYWDEENGAYFGWDADGVYVETLRNGSRESKIYQENWNRNGKVNPQDALQKGTISRIILALYNFGTIGFELYKRESDTDELYSDIIHNLGVDGDTTLASQDNPIRVEVDNPDTTDFDVFVSDRQATVRGQFTPNRRIKGERRTGVSLSGTTWVPIISFRRKDGFTTINTELFNLLVKPDEDIYLQVRENAGSTADADYEAPQDVKASETAVEVDTSPTGDITDGYFLFQTQFDGGQNNRSTLGSFNNVDLELNNARPMTVFARTVSATGGNLTAFNLNWSENW